MPIVRPRLNSRAHKLHKTSSTLDVVVSDERIRKISGGSSIGENETIEKAFQDVLNLRALEDRTYLHLSNLIACDHLFIIEATEVPKEMLDEEGEKHKIFFQILDQDAVVIYFAVAKVSRNCIFTSFEVKLKNKRNVDVIRFVGNKIFGGGLTVSAPQYRENLGKVKQLGPFCTEDYKLQNNIGKELCRVRPINTSVGCFNCKLPEEYGLFEPMDCANVGYIKKNWADSGLVDIIDWSHRGAGQIYGASFPELLTIPCKVLILASIFAIKIMRKDII